MKRRLRSVAWDIDGTLIDSEPAHHQALIEACAGYGLNLRGIPTDTFLGAHVRDVWRALQPRLPNDVSQGAWIAAIEADYARRASALEPRPGAVETVRALWRRGVPQCAVSNSGRSVVDANIAALGIEDTLQFTLALDDVREGKPSPEPYLEACARMGVPPDETIAVEDSRTGARSARLAGLFVVGVGQDVGADIDTHLDDIRHIAEILGD